VTKGHVEKSAWPFFAFAFLAMLDLPLRQQIGPIGKAAHDAIHMGLRDRLQNNPAKLIFQKFNFGAGFDPVLSTEFRWITSWPLEVNLAVRSFMA
jgi:hypothetical protein